jgi:paired small multidrug resistance pump
MGWIFLLIASLGEIFAVMYIQFFLRRKSFFHVSMIVVSFGFGFLFLSLALQTITLSIAYAVWTAIGALGNVLMGIFFFHESTGWKRLMFLGCIIVGAVGLKLTHS